MPRRTTSRSSSPRDCDARIGCRTHHSSCSPLTRVVAGTPTPADQTLPGVGPRGSRRTVPDAGSEGQPTRAEYAAASSRPSTSDASLISMTKIQPSPYGSSLSFCGASVSSALTSTTVPDSGAYTSDTDLVDSTSLAEPPATTEVPTSGSCTNTTSPRASWA